MHSRILAAALLTLSLAACGRESASAELVPAPKPEATVQPAAAVSASPAPAHAAPAASASTTATVEERSLPKASLEVKRFVVASAVESREPVVAEQLALGAGPVFAFAELENRGDEAKIVITFERDGTTTSVGHVKLAVPAASKRWRTWGKSHQVKHAGRWSAVLRDEHGTELARRSFEVTPLTSEPVEQPSIAATKPPST